MNDYLKGFRSLGRHAAKPGPDMDLYKTFMTWHIKSSSRGT